MLRTISGLLFLLLATQFAAAENRVFVCPEGRVEGQRFGLDDDDQLSFHEDSISHQSETIALIMDKEKVAKLFFDDKTIEATYAHRIGNHTVITYVFGGVFHSDVFYDDGLYVSQYAKSGMIGPRNFTFHQQCVPKLIPVKQP